MLTDTSEKLYIASFICTNAWTDMDVFAIDSNVDIWVTSTPEADILQKIKDKTRKEVCTDYDDYEDEDEDEDLEKKYGLFRFPSKKMYELIDGWKTLEDWRKCDTYMEPHRTDRSFEVNYMFTEMTKDAKMSFGTSDEIAVNDD